MSLLFLIHLHALHPIIRLFCFLSSPPPKGISLQSTTHKTNSPPMIPPTAAITWPAPCVGAPAALLAVGLASPLATVTTVEIVLAASILLVLVLTKVETTL